MPASLIYDYRLKIRVNVDHILGDENNLERIPNELKGEGGDSLRCLFEGAVMEAERRAAANYMIAVPQYYNGKIQLLLSICLLGNAPDLALAIQRESGYYSARACFTLEMAYNNARLVNRPESTWIMPGASSRVALTCLAAVRLRSADASGFDCSYAEPSGADGRSFAGSSDWDACIPACSRPDEPVLELFRIRRVLLRQASCSLDP